MSFFEGVGLMLQDMFIKMNSFIHPSVIHNLEKHTVIKKALFYKFLENIPGDYIEFGVYKGTSLKGAAAYWNNISRQNMRFIGFDSFEGMRPEKKDDHPFYTTFDFSASFSKVKSRFSSFPNVKLVKGFFQETLKEPPSKFKIKKAAIVMVDCDLYSSSQSVFSFIKPVVDKGTILILDDYFNYQGGKERGVRAAFEEFKKKSGIECDEIMKYGVGGIVFLITKVANK